MVIADTEPLSSIGLITTYRYYAFMTNVKDDMDTFKRTSSPKPKFEKSIALVGLMGSG